MSIHQNFPPFNQAAKQNIAASAAELLDGLWVAYAGATQAYQANPTERRWRERVSAHAAWSVAYRAEDGEAHERR